MNPVLRMYDIGYTPADVKALFLKTLRAYFRDETVLKERDAGTLGIVATNVGVLAQDPVNQRLLELAVKHGWAALDAGTGDSLSTCAYWEKSMVKAMTEFWSLSNRELLKAELPLEDFRVEIFHNIGSLIEACLKPALGYILSQIRVSKGAPSPSYAVEQLDLGGIVNELHQVFGDTELTEPSPWTVRLNQWRNIAQHHSTFIRNGSIVCEYGKGNSKKEVELTRQEALAVGKRVGDILKIVNTARLIYMDEFALPLERYLPATEMREEVLTFRFITAVGTQGFAVEELDLTTEAVVARIRDRMERPWMQGLVHTSQFLFYLWQLHPKDRLEIYYKSKDGTERGRTWARGADIARVAELAAPLEKLADSVHFEPRLHKH